MFIQQISIFAENRNGAILEITDALQKANINIRALCIADTADFGVVRLIVDQTQLAIDALKQQNIPVSETPVIALSVPDQPGGFHAVLEALEESEITIEYSYAFIAPIRGGATVILRCKEQEKAYTLLQSKGIQLLSQADVSL